MLVKSRKHQRRPHILQVLLDLEEFEELKDMAWSKKITMAALVRSLVASEAIRIKSQIK